ncbi:serine O-acetyltransferase [Phyllobacterium endophyticum]|uniref:Serine acetyltransferase n=1 Tax=Phyllobacterium endophyticum TaxID=1149773 RepID=A0A2P7B0C8_9HYPH|nr:serine O-acetyltransferase [Phyllobacterium endophyticum]MBB3235517.1 serine O-acetyltransferase [Phyllobacterium endophyticum]PSH59844.1 serine O-acetyltransferase [Phyllobacterium endophyticum]TXR47944.1 serine O-acetyltransferase [Phyllobacterium endophyticum]TYR41994.1 serine O-acetyltransferase [Phyllobacterium endophyticum]
MPVSCFNLLPTEFTSSSLVASIWNELCSEAVAAMRIDPAVTRPMNSAVLYHAGFAQALAHRIALKLASPDIDQDELLAFICQTFLNDPAILAKAATDLIAIKERDPCNFEILTPFLYFKGFLALQGQRVAHWMWNHERFHLARHLQSRISEVFGVDIHPAARMGKGIMLDHGSGLVIGETAVVEDDVSILQNVTLGGTGKETGDRHPKIRRGALIGAGAKILGNIEIGMGAKVGAGSVVVAPVLPYTSVVGVPARVVGKTHSMMPGVTMDQTLCEPEYFI